MECVMRNVSSWIWFLVSFTLLILLNTVVQTGCADLTSSHVSLVTEHGSSEQGGMEPIIQMPFQNGKSSQCVQGAGGSFSHNGTATKFDIDFDTSNSVKEELFSPVSGTVYVHTEDASKNFGNHVCIDLGNGSYVILGHMSDVNVQNGQEVAVGQLLGHEGCTGYCSGDHVHVGLHKGDAKQMGQFGVSIPVNYLLKDKTSGEDAKAIASSSLVCGLKSFGDAVDGHFYTSTLPTALFHPEGTLLKTPTGSKVYLVLKGGMLSWIQNETAFKSRGYDFKKVILVSEEEIACYDPGVDLSGKGYIDAFYDGSNQLWLLVGASDAPDRFRKRVVTNSWSLVLSSWGLAYSTQTPPSQGSQDVSFLGNWPITSGSVGFRDGTLVRETSHSDLYVIVGGVAVPIVNWDTFLLLGYHASQVLTVPDGDLALIHSAMGNCSASLWCLEKTAVASCGGVGFSTEGASTKSSDVPISISSVKDSDAGSSDSSGTSPSYVEPDAGSTDTFVYVSPPEFDAGSTDTQLANPSEPDVIDSKKDTDTLKPPPTPVTSSDDVWLNDYGLDGAQETLMIRDDRWLNPNLIGKDVYVYGVGGCFDNILTESDRVTSTQGYYQIDFSKFENACVGELTLVSSIGTDGNPPNASMTNWYWWQDAPFCYTGSKICQLEKNNTSWEEWLLRVSWNLSDGLQSAGNGFTKNTQLK